MAELCPAERFRAAGRWLRLALSTSHHSVGGKRGASPQPLAWMLCLRPGSHIQEPSKQPPLASQAAHQPESHPEAGYGSGRGRSRGFRKVPAGQGQKPEQSQEGEQLTKTPCHERRNRGSRSISGLGQRFQYGPWASSVRRPWEPVTREALGSTLAFLHMTQGGSRGSACDRPW